MMGKRISTGETNEDIQCRRATVLVDLAQFAFFTPVSELAKLNIRHSRNRQSKLTQTCVGSPTHVTLAASEKSEEKSGAAKVGTAQKAPPKSTPRREVRVPAPIPH